MKSPKTTSILITLGFLLTLNAESRGGVRGAGFSFPHSTPALLRSIPLSSGPLPAGFDRESESHPRSPIPRLTTHTAHYMHLFTPPSSNVLSLLTILETSSQVPFSLKTALFPLLSGLFLHSSLACCFTKLGKAPTSWFRLVTDRLPCKTSGCGPREIALMFWQLYLRHAF